MCSARVDMEEKDSKAEHEHGKADHNLPPKRHFDTCDVSTSDIPFSPKRMASVPKRDPPSTLSSNSKRRKVDTQQVDEDEGEIQDDKKRLACPFFKRKPTKTRPSCVYPGFKSIARLKEHLYRQHMLPQHLCSRCLETFSSEAELREHSRAPTPCQVNVNTNVEGITLDQEKALKSKKRTSKSGINTNEEKWKDIYTILFPTESPPSAFCDTVSDTPRYEEILRQELPTLVEAEIQNNEKLLEHSRAILDIVWHCLEKTFSKWHQTQSTAEMHPGATPTATKTPPSIQINPPDGASPPVTPKAMDVSTLDSASPQSTVSTADSTRCSPMGNDPVEPAT